MIESSDQVLGFCFQMIFDLLDKVEKILKYGLIIFIHASLFSSL